MYVLSKVSKQWQRLLYFLVCNSQMSLIFCEASEFQVKNVKATLICFEAVLGLKVNFFFKSEHIGIKINDSYLHQLAAIFSCKAGALPTAYLGLRLCTRTAKKSEWDPVVERIEQRVSH